MADDVRDYHRALEMILAAPLQLTDHDFAVLQAFNPADEQRGRDAQRQAQLALVPMNLADKVESDPSIVAAAATMSATTAPPLVTKAADARASVPPSWLTPASLGRALATAIHQAAGPDRARLTALADRVTALEVTIDAQAKTITGLEASNRALGQLVTRTVDPPRRATPSLEDLDDLVASSTAKH